jgi:hypothetical protein
VAVSTNEEITAGEFNTRHVAVAAGWYAPGDEPSTEHWHRRLRRRKNPKWDSFSWLTVRALLESVNDVVAKGGPTVIRRRRTRWLAAQRASGIEQAEGGWPAANGAFKPDLTVDWKGLGRPVRFIILGDPGEADASQYAVIDPLLEVHQGRADGQDHVSQGTVPTKSDFMVILSDVIYPAGDINEYVNGFYRPYEEYNSRIYALPGNHDWYDGLNGFMFHFCAAESLPKPSYRLWSYGPAERAALLAWRGASRPDLDELAPWMSARQRAQAGAAVPERADDDESYGPMPGGSPYLSPPQRRPVQPAPYFAIDTDHVLIVSIDTGVLGEIDAEQGDWLRRISRVPKAKVLLTGKPIYVNNEYHPCEITWGEEAPERDAELGSELRPLTVDDIVRHPESRYVAAIGGDVHNYQRYPVELTDGRTIQYIVSGGGGAYLSATHMIPTVGPTVAQDLPPDVRGFDEKGFRSYPLRGDSLTRFTRTMGPILLRAVFSAVTLIAAAVVVFWAVLDGRISDYWMAVLSASLGASVLVALIAALFVARDKVLEVLPKGFRAGIIAAGIVIVGLAVATTLVLIENPSVSEAVAVTLGLPFLLIAGIILSYDLRGSSPRFTKSLLLVAPLIALWILFTPIDARGAWETVAYVLAPIFVAIVLVAALEAAKRRVSEDSYYDAYRVALALAWAALTGKVLYEHADGNLFGSNAWLTWTVATLLGVAILIWQVIPRTTPRPADHEVPDPRRTGETAGGVVAISLVALAFLALEAVGDGWPAYVTAAALFGIAGMLSVLLLAGVLYLGLWPWVLPHLRTGKLDPGYAARFVSKRIGGLPPVRSSNIDSANSDDDGERKHRMAEAVRRLGKGVSTLADSNVPPFLKSFLEVEANREQLTIRLYGVTGYGKQPTLEETVDIPLSTDMNVPQLAGTEHSHWALWTTWRRGPEHLAHIAQIVADRTCSPAEIRVRVRDDVETTTNGKDLAAELTGEGIKGFDAILIEGRGEGLRVRIAFVRRKRDILIGDRVPRQASIKRGVVLEVMSTSPARGTKVAQVKEEIANAIERGRPRWISRIARHGQGTRALVEPGQVDLSGASASRKLEERLRKWPGVNPFPALFIVAAMGLYVAAVEVFGDWGSCEKLAVIPIGLAVGVAAYVLQRWLFPSVEVANLPNARRAGKLALSYFPIPALVAGLVELSEVEKLFS